MNTRPACKRWREQRNNYQIAECDIITESTTILIVDDNIAVAMASRALLEHYDYHVLVAHSGSTGLEILRANSGIIDLIILDWILPSMSGDQWLELFLEISPDVKVIFTTAKFITEELRQQVETKVQDFLKKPFTAGQLLDLVEKALQGYASGNKGLW